MSRGADRGAAIRVLVADSTRLGSQLIVEALGHDPRFEVAAVAAEEVLSSVHDQYPNVLLLSAKPNGPEILRTMRGRVQGILAVMLLDDASDEMALEAFRAGSRGVICRNESVESLRKCVWSVHQGQIWANSHQLHLLLATLEAESVVMTKTYSVNVSEFLSRREREVVRGVAEGMTNRAIADELRLSEHTIKNYLFRVFTKLGVSNRSELILQVLRQRKREGY